MLIAYTNFNASVSYVQGMNFIAASFLYHCEEFVAFWLMNYLLDTLQMKDIYSQCKLYIIYFSSFSGALETLLNARDFNIRQDVWPLPALVYWGGKNRDVLLLVDYIALRGGCATKTNCNIYYLNVLALGIWRNF